jgi:hypothetical protein
VRLSNTVVLEARLEGVGERPVDLLVSTTLEADVRGVGVEDLSGFLCGIAARLADRTSPRPLYAVGDHSA